MTLSARTKSAVFCLFALAGLAAYWNALDAFFLSDDFAQIGKVLTGDWSVTWGREHGGFFRPLFILSYAADAWLWGRQPLGFHLTNLALHVTNSFLVFLLSLSLLGESELAPQRQKQLSLEKKLSFAAGLIFLLHPSHTEAVSWISGRADLLSTLFCLSALLFYINYARQTQTNSARDGRRANLFVSLFMFALALLSKESAVCFPLLILLTGFYLRRSAGVASAFTRTLKSTLPFIYLLALYVLARSLALGALIGGYGAEQHLQFTHGVVASQLLRFSLRAVFPVVALRSFPFLESRALSPTLIAVGALVLLLTIILLRRTQARRAFFARVKRNNFLLFLLALSLCCLLPAFNLRINVFDTQGERFLYLLSAFFSTAAAYLLLKLARRNEKLWAALLCCLLLLYAFGLWKTNQTWSEAARLSRSTLEGVARLSTHDKVILLNAPDNLRGAYIFRNGFEQALKSFQHTKGFARAFVVAFHGLDSRADEVVVSNEAGALSLRLTNPRTSFERTGEAHPCVTVLDHAGGLLRLRLNDCGEVFDLFVLSSGEVFKVAETR